MGEINASRWKKMKISVDVGELQFEHMSVEQQGKS